MRDVLKLIKLSEFLVDAELRTVLHALNGMLRNENYLNKFEKQDRQTCFVKSQVKDV